MLRKKKELFIKQLPEKEDKSSRNKNLGLYLKSMWRKITYLTQVLVQWKCALDQKKWPEKGQHKL